MKYKLISSVFLILFVTITEIFAQSIDSLTSKTDDFLKNYVNSGLVDYALVKENITELNQLVSMYQTNLPVSNPKKKAFLINLYNLGAIKLLAENYPVSSPKNVSNFYDKKFIDLQSDKLSLNELENLIRKEYNDPRVHFVLVCGAMGCPPITNFAYQDFKLDEQLTQQTKLALNNPEFIRVDKNSVLISELFKWYEADFTKDSKNCIEFINKFRTSPIHPSSSSDYYTYDWKINDSRSIAQNTTPFDPNEESTKKSTQDFTPSVLYTKGQWEIKHFNNIYSQTQGFDKDGNKVKYDSRGTYFTSINQVLIGVNSRFNVGFDFWVKSVRIDDKASSPFSILSFQNSSKSRTALSSIGPKIKIQPFKKLSHLSIQSTLLIPVAKDQEGASNGKPYLSQDSYISITQIFYDQAIGKKLQLFFSLSPWLYVKKNASAASKRTSLSSPLDIFVSFFATPRLTLYTQQGFWPNYGDKGINSWFRQEGFGVKYQVIKGKLEIESSYTKFTMGKEQGAGATYNFGVRIMHL